MAEKGIPQVDVTCSPAGCVLMAEQAYSLPSGPTRTGLTDSISHPGQMVSKGHG